MPYIEGHMPEWRNWQTRWTQNPVLGDKGVGSIPSSGTLIFLVYQRFKESLTLTLSFRPEP